METLSRFSLAPGDAAPVDLINIDGAAPVVLVCEHAGRALPMALRPGAPRPEDMARHIAWDIGAGPLARALADRLDAPLVLQPYSRLVIDCNRPRHAADLAPALSDGTPVPFNRGLDEGEIDARWQAIHQPFHRAVAGLLDRRGHVALVAVHSFTPQLRGQAPRTMHAGLLVRSDFALAEAMREALLAEQPYLSVLFNAPYRIDDDSDYTIPVHGEMRGLPNVLVEVRNDTIADASGVARWAELLTRACRSGSYPHGRERLSLWTSMP